MKTYRPWEPDRTYLLPPSTRDWLPEDHLASFILDVVDELDITAIEFVIQKKDPRGEKPYSPRMLLALLLYGYSSGVFSSRGLARATWTDLGARVIAAESHPHFTTINQFRLDHRAALGGLFIQVLGLCRQAGLVQLGHVAIDGTKIQANASKHKAMSYDRMKKTEKRLQEEVDDLFARADEVDRAEDAQFGPDNDGTNIPDELRRRETRLKRIREAKAALEREAAAARKLELEEQAQRAARAAAEAEDPKESAKLARRADARKKAAESLGDVKASDIPGSQRGLPFHTVPHDLTGIPKPKAQRNFTDPESRIMATGGTFVQAYNCQVAVDEKAQVILAQCLTNQGVDFEQLRPMLRLVHDNLGELPQQVTADAGYWSPQNAEFCEANNIDAYISTRRRRHDEGSERPPDQPVQLSANTEAGRKMEAKVNTEEGRAIYAKRKWTVEPVFGQTKEGRGFRRFGLRGIDKAGAEFTLVCIAHNLLKLKAGRKK